jgi:hypothetical protein
VIAMADDVRAWCEKTSSHGRTVTMKIKWADFQISTCSRSMEMMIQSREKRHQVALDQIRSVFPRLKAFDSSAWRSRTFDRKPSAKRLNSLLVKCSRRLPTGGHPLVPTDWSPIPANDMVRKCRAQRS